jgi:hypothetical protein
MTQIVIMLYEDNTRVRSKRGGVRKGPFFLLPLKSNFLKNI